MATESRPVDSSEPMPPRVAESPSASTREGSPAEIGGPAGLEPTRYGDWERKGRCIDF